MINSSRPISLKRVNKIYHILFLKSELVGCFRWLQQQWQHVHKTILSVAWRGLREVNYHPLKQVFSHFLHRHNVLKEDVRTAATFTVERVEEFWFRAKIPTKHRQDSIKKLEQLFGQRKGLKKNQNRKTETQRAKEAEFSEMIEELFDIAHDKAMELIQNEDKLFLDPSGR